MRALSVVPELCGDRADSHSGDRAGRNREGTEPGHRPDLIEARTKHLEGGQARVEQNHMPRVAGMSKARALALLFSLGVSLATMLLMVATEPRMAIGWDEGYTLGREQRLREWFRGLRDPAEFAAQWRPLPPDQELVQPSAHPPAPLCSARYSTKAAVRPRRAGVVLAVCARRAARPSSVLCPGRVER